MQSSAFSRAMTRVGMVLSILVPLWAAAGRKLFDIDGTMTIILSSIGLPVLLVVYLLIVWVPWVRERNTGLGLSNRAAGFFLLSLLSGAVFGFLCPDFGSPEAKSMLEHFGGPEMQGMAAAIANPFGIGTLFFAALAVGFALRDSAGKVSYTSIPPAADPVGAEEEEDLMIPAPWMVGRDELKFDDSTQDPAAEER